MYDVILACALIPAAPPPEFVAESAIYRFFDEHFRIEDERPRTIEWVRRVLAHDTGAHRLAAR